MCMLEHSGRRPRVALRPITCRPRWRFVARRRPGGGLVSTHKHTSLNPGAVGVESHERQPSLFGLIISAGSPTCPKNRAVVISHPVLQPGCQSNAGVHTNTNAQSGSPTLCPCSNEDLLAVLTSTRTFRKCFTARWRPCNHNWDVAGCRRCVSAVSRGSFRSVAFKVSQI